MVTRRSFVKRTALATAVSGPFFSGKVFAAQQGDIAAITGTSIEAAVRAAVAGVGGIGAFVKKGDRVAIKPNLSFASPVDRAATTNPQVVAAVVKLCQEAGAKQIVVVDHPLQDAAVIGDKSELATLIKSMSGVSLMLPSTESLYKEVTITGAKEMKTTKVARILDDIDVLINVPIAKNHSATAVSLGIKGNLGLVWDRIAYHNATDFDQTLADLATVFKPKLKLTIVDAIRALATRGPQGPGQVLKLDTIIAGKDPVAVDSYAVAFTFKKWNLTGMNVKHLVKAAAMGLGEIDPTKLNVITQTI